jgi:hypothetical protein
MKTEFIVMTAAAAMPASCRGRYGKVAVLEVEKGVWPKMISERARGVVRIVSIRQPLHIGGSRSAYALALNDAERLARGLNLEAQMEERAVHDDEPRPADRVGH